MKKNLLCRAMALTVMSLFVFASCQTKKDDPTDNPKIDTPTPTIAATAVPTEAPVITDMPTEKPTEDTVATEAPTEDPTEAPTETPTEAPTEEPPESPDEHTVIAMDPVYNKRLGLPLEVRISSRYPRPEVLPQGNMGLAARYPGDIGIENDPSVIVCDDFESYAQELVSDAMLAGKWRQSMGHGNEFHIIDSSEYGRDGQSLQFLCLSETNNSLDFRLQVTDSDIDTIYIRYYEYWSENYDLVLGSSHCGVGVLGVNPTFYGGSINTPISSDLNAPMGYDFFNVHHDYSKADDPFKRDPGRVNLYSYYPTQSTWHGDHHFPGGEIRGGSTLTGKQKTDCYYSPNFVPMDEVYPDLGVWYCWEYMLKANTVVDGVTQRDGRMTVWMDGVIIQDHPNFVYRYVEDVKICVVRFVLNNNPVRDRPAFKLIDNIVIAREYVGPVYE